MSDVSTTDEWAKRLVERLRQNPLRRTRNAEDFAELEDEIARLRDENAALRAAVERVRALHTGRVVSSGLRRVCWECEMPFPCPTLRALEETP